MRMLRDAIRVALGGALTMAAFASCTSQDVDTGSSDSQGGTEAAGASNGGDAASGTGGSAGSAGSGGSASVGAAGEAGQGGEGGSGDDACTGANDGVHCGADLSADADTRYFCRGGATLGTGSCPFGCRMAACTDEGGGTTGGSGFGTGPGTCSLCVSDWCDVPSAACTADAGCMRVLACAHTCVDMDCVELCRSLFSDGASLYNVLLGCVRTNCVACAAEAS